MKRDWIKYFRDKIKNSVGDEEKSYWKYQLSKELLHVQTCSVR